MYTLYAYIKHPLHFDYQVAVVGTYETQNEAEQKMETEILCYSDDGLSFCITGEDVDIPDHSLFSYRSLIERVSK